MDAQILDQLADDIAYKGYGIIDDFIPRELSVPLLQRLLDLRAEGQLKKAGIGRSSDFTTNSKIRGDQIKWIEPEEAAEVTTQFLEKIEAVIDFFNRSCYVGIRDYEAHFAVYPPGAFYKRHLDQFSTNDNRRFTFLLYLNFDWQPEDAGCLRIYFLDGANESHLDIEPIAGRLVCFKSDLLEHEVLPTNKTRYSIAGWWLDREKDLAFLS